MTADSSSDSVNQKSADYVGSDEQDTLPRSGESAELLRWRADILMDEMMLGGLDTSAGAHANGAASGQQNMEAAGGTTADSVGAPPASTPQSTDPTAAALGAMVESATESADADHATTTDELDWWRHPTRIIKEPRGTQAVDFPAPATTDRPTAYAPEHPTSYSAAPNYGSTAAAPSGASPDMSPGEATSDALLRQPTTTQASAAVANANSTAGSTEVSSGAPEASEPGRSATARMQGRGGTRTNLLPRNSGVNAEALWREIDEMRAEIGEVIPENHEWSVRSRHLLDKGETILRQNPERTAEVEYYLNQVRGVMERVRQSYRWSQVYVKRLNLYLIAWIAFAAVAAVGCFLYRESLVEFFTLLTGRPADGFFMQTLPLWFATMAVGALGGAIGARINMQRHQRLEYGFFDRKYSLRGLLLPLMAAFVAMLIFVPFALVAYFAPLSALVALTLILTGAALAFAYGLFQESFYGIGP